MLPNAHNLPPEAAQLAAHMPVTFTVVSDFGIPEFPVALGSLVTLWAAVPKTTVHKNYNPLAPECEIRLTKKSLITPPAGDAVLPKDCNQPQFCFFVSARADQ